MENNIKPAAEKQAMAQCNSPATEQRRENSSRTAETPAPPLSRERNHTNKTFNTEWVMKKHVFWDKHINIWLVKYRPRNISLCVGSRLRLHFIHIKGCKCFTLRSTGDNMMKKEFKGAKGRTNSGQHLFLLTLFCSELYWKWITQKVLKIKNFKKLGKIMSRARAHRASKQWTKQWKTGGTGDRTDRRQRTWLVKNTLGGAIRKIKSRCAWAKKKSTLIKTSEIEN